MRLNWGSMAGKTLVILLALSLPTAVSGASDTSRATVVSVNEIDERIHDLVVESPSVGMVTVRLLLPTAYDERPEVTWPVMYLLHGQGGDHSNWTNGSSVVDLTADLDVLVVMPDAMAGWYSDWWNAGAGGAPMWETFHIGELRQILEDDWRASDRRVIAGLSMGGFGAMSYAAREPGMFRAAASYSGVLDPLGSRFFHDYRLWGDKVVQVDIWEAHDPVALAPALQGIDLYVWYGDGSEGAGLPTVDGLEEWLVGHNQAFVASLGESGIAVTVESGPGTHTWPYWNAAFASSLPILLAALDE